MRFRIFINALAVLFCFNAVAVTGSGTSSTTPLETISPSLQSASSVTEKTLSANFSEAVLAPGSTTPGSYAVSGLGAGALVPSPSGVSGGPSAFILDWAAGEMRDGVALTLTVTGVQDAMGNPINPVANSASCPGMGTAPVFSDLIVTPTKAAAGDTVTISISASETLQSDPEVTINGHPASTPYGKAETYLYEYEVQEDDPLGMAVIHISGADLAGNVGTLNATGALEILEESEDLPLWGWPIAAAVLLAMGLVFLWRKKRGLTQAKRSGDVSVPAFWLLVVAMLAAPWAFAQSPTVSNVTMTQSPTATSTQVDIYYDLDAPNGPCDITVSLSKDGGADGYIHPVTSITGDIADVTTGTGKHIVWDIRADYPEEDLPGARILVTADDGVVAPEVASFSINNGAVTTADPIVTLDNTATNSPAEYMASEASDFSGASWQPYDMAPNFTFSSVEVGTKTVYFKVRNAAGESAPISDIINLVEERTILLPGDVPLELVWVPSGSYQMGRYPGEYDSSTNEDLQHPVTLAYGFWMGKYEITQQQWLAVQGSWPQFPPSATYGIGDTYPAYWISWNDVKDFITSLNAHIVSSGQGPLTVRLPSEAEWEYACRAGTTTRFYWGDDSDYTQLGNYAWYSGNNSPLGCKPVGSKTVNAFGLYDMSGNMWEWCDDDYHANYTGAPADGSAWINSPRASYRTIRGGAYWYEAKYCRSAFRYYYLPHLRTDMIGFRLAVDLPPTVTDFAINGGAATTADPVVTLDNATDYRATEYMASETSDFSGATWQPYGTAPTFTLSSSEGGTKTVYFKVRNAAGESSLVSDTIELKGRTITLPGDVPLELVWVSGGTFMMGRYPGEADSDAGEDPQHPVTLADGFWIGKYEITQQQWLAVQGSWPGTAPDSGSGLGDTYPAYNLSWDDAKDFITTLNAHILSSGQGPLTVRLPSEPEWEYACRAETQTRFYWGDDLTYTQIGNYAWYFGNNSPGGTKPVGGKTANALGLYDMSGNMYEWCEDDYHSSYTGAPSDGSAWIDAPRASYRIVRGGCWIADAKCGRSAYRDSALPDSQYHVIGFRLAASFNVASFAINSGAATTTDPVVTLNNACVGAPTEYMASESSDFSDASWQPYDTAPTFTLSSGEGGTKTVYFKVRNAAGESAPVSDTIELTGHTITLPGDVPLELVWVQGGTFMMGRYPGEADSSDKEDPQHQVTLDYGFWMGKYEITQQQWFAVKGAWPGWPPMTGNGVGDTCPVYFPSWYAAKDFTTSLNAHIVSSGQGPLTVRLPSEAEWEYACRAGTTTRFYWGDDADYTQIGDYAWYSGNNSPLGSKPVGGKLPNAFGLYDMSGNIQEWCEDDAHYDYTGAPSNGSAWIDSPRGVSRVFRGGPWDNSARNSRSANRYTNGAGNASYNIGFRIAAVPTQVLSFTINGGAATTADPVVTLDNTATNSPTEYMASESRDFSGATWQPYIMAPAFTLSSFEGGTKTVYFKVRNEAGESAPVSDTIDLTGRTVTLPGDVPLELLWVPGGTFMMGRYSGEADSAAGEDPQHPVTLAYGFWMGKYEITQQQWLAVRGSWPDESPSSGVGNSYPAYNISWDDAKEFITTLNAHIAGSGQGPLTVRLPSEAEWEYACRAGTQTRFYWGDDPTYTEIGTYAWYFGNNSPTGTKPVGGKTANALGLYDMSGNMYEWCEDDYHSSYTGAPADGSAWIDAPRGEYRIVRGGCWIADARCGRSAYRDSSMPDSRYSVIGFRLAAVPTQVVSFTINGGAATTTDPVVTLDNTATNSPTEYMASESPDFSDATWQPYDTAPIFTLSSAEGGTKTVYFKVRNAGGESAPVSDTIEFVARTITLPGDVPLELVWVPAGTCMMGRYPGEADSDDNEDPQHPVTLAYGFWMGKYEITQQQWLAVRGSWPGATPSSGVGDRYPAYNISWYDARDFITSLNAHIVSSGQGPLMVRMPSEAEWEYACRAGTTTRFYFGDASGCDPYFSDCEAGTLPGNLSDYMWYYGNNSPNGSKPVGGKLPNTLGLYDMHGNIVEWCEDDSHDDYIGAPSDGNAWVESPRTEHRMLKGGAWWDFIMYCRVACRGHLPADFRDSAIGFRLAAAPTQVLSLAINNGAATTSDLLVTLDNTATNSPVEYMASEASDFSGATWEPYDTAPSFNLSFGAGTRTVYFKVRDAGGEVFNVVSDTIFVLPRTVPVGTGTFTMGRTASGDDATYGAAAELPRHEVRLGTYQIGKYEVTSKEYCDVLNWAKAQGYLTDSAGNPWTPLSVQIYAGGTAASRYLIALTSSIQYSGGMFTAKTRTGLPGTTTYATDTHPMTEVSWYGAAAFCNWLSEWQGLTPCYDMNTEFWPLTVAPPTPGGYRLPTEAEWERAAAWDGTKHWIYCFISDTLTGKDRANYYDPPDSVNPLGLTTEPYTSPVGWFDGVNVSPNGIVATVDSPSPVGAYDMSGNVAELCHDWLSTTYYSGGSMTNPTGPVTGTGRIARGGYYDNNREYCRSARRTGFTPTNTNQRFGFRLAKSEPSVGMTSFAINNGDATTMLPSVTLNNTCWSTPTEYMASESSDFSGASWQPYDTAPSFTLSSGEGGTKTVYFKVRGAEGESALVSDTIELTGRSIALPGDVPLELVWVPSGSFQMGRYPGEVDSVSSEDPQHPVTLAYGFWMGKYEVTQQQWLAARGAWPATAPSSGWGLGNTYPAYNISWDDVQDFNTSLNAHIVSSGQGPLTVRLPSEAEWEYACRAGTQTRFYWGDDPGYTEIGAYAWYSTGATNPVGGKTANAYGLYDMSGNVFEWCEDDYHDGYTGAPADGSVWIDAPRAAIRIVRGGSWGSGASYCRSAFRSGFTAGGRGTNYGFRLSAITPPEVTSFAINGGAASTTDPVVTLNNTAVNSPAEYMASEASDFSGATWQPYDTAPAFTLSFGVGTRTVYFKVRKSGREVTTVVSDTIFLAPNTVSVETGVFTMGRTASGDDAAYGTTNEDPQHEVLLGTYQLGKGEVTNKEYCDVLNWALAQGYLYADVAGTPWSGGGIIYVGGAAGSRYLTINVASTYCNIQYSGGVFTSKTRVGLPGTTNYSMDMHPMVEVSWYGAVAFCNWLSQMQGLTPCYDMNSPEWPLIMAPPTPGGYRLPTEAEWERAAAWDSAGGGKHWIYCFISDTLTSKDRANYYDSTPDYVNPLGLTMEPYTSPVGWFDGVNVSPNGVVATVDSPSPVGAYDMSGNVTEFCQDWHSSIYYNGGSMTNPTGPATGSSRVVRGGAYILGRDYSRSANRLSAIPTSTSRTRGFRLAKSEPSVGTTSFAINNGDTTTILPTVTLNNTCWGTPTEYMASEANDFSGATWQPYDTAPGFTLSSAEGGTKTVYFKVRNAEYESAPVSDTINMTARTETLPGNVPLELVWVPAGSFQMGRYPGEVDSFDWEDPQHPVTLAYGFWMGKYEITQQQWLAVRGSWPGPPPDYGYNASHPAYPLSWNDAKDFITSLNAHIVSSGQGPLTVRLPSEAEWEYACRAGTTTRFYCGDAPGCDAFCLDCAAGTLPGNLSDYLWYCPSQSSGPQPVGGKLPNAFGLYDMHGSIHEWCEDDSHYNYLGAPVDGSPWIESPRTEYHMLKGGYWYEALTYCRAACRSHYPADVREMAFGFRLAALPTRVLSLAINGGADTTTDLLVTLNNTATNSPTVYMASETPDFSGATWQPYGTAPGFTLSYGVGARTVYFKVRDAGGEAFNVVSDTIFLTPNTVSVGAGTFTMGRLDSGTNDDVTYGATYELPQHEVTLGAYQLGKYEVTCKEYCDVLNWAKAKGYLYADAAGTPWSGSGDIYAGGTAMSRYLAVKLTASDCNIRLWGGLFTPKTRAGLPSTTNYAMDTHPMIAISWYGAVAFCNWLSAWQGVTPCYDMNAPEWPLTTAPPTQGGYRLPTEAEWERAAGWDAAGVGRHWIYSFLSDTLTGRDRANYVESGVGHVNPLGLTTTPRTSPVGWFNGVNVSPNGTVATVDSPSPVGAYDMSGNVQEWCHDWFADNYGDGPVTNPTGPATGSNRINRGGYWNNTNSYCRSACRVSYAPTTASSVFGFRLARSE